MALYSLFKIQNLSFKISRMKEVYICSAVRTPIGSFGGMFAGLTAVQLGSAAITGALERDRHQHAKQLSPQV